VLIRTRVGFWLNVRFVRFVRLMCARTHAPAQRDIKGFREKNRTSVIPWHIRKPSGGIGRLSRACFQRILGLNFVRESINLYNSQVGMTFQPGQSGNPNGYSGPRNRRRHEVFELIKGLGHKDALEILSTTANDEKADLGLRVAAASALAPFCHPKMQATPTPRFVDNPIDVPTFTHLSDAESFLAKIAVLVARGELDFQSGLDLSALAKNWIDAQYAREELAIKQINAGTTEHEQIIKIEGGLPALPGTTITMPVLDHGPATNGHALEPPTPVAPPIESTPVDSTATNDQGPEPEGGKL
jgi:hypothetical protein